MFDDLADHEQLAFEGCCIQVTAADEYLPHHRLNGLHTLAELQVFRAPHEPTALMLMRPQVCTVEGSALIYVVAKPL